MKTAIFFLQSTEQTERLRRLIAEAIEQKYTRFITAICLTEKKGLAFTLDLRSPQDFPENLFQSDRVEIVRDPLIWLCERGETVLAVWDGTENAVFKQLVFCKAWGLTGVCFNSQCGILEAL
jgi:hypothetical protein